MKITVVHRARIIFLPVRPRVAAGDPRPSLEERYPSHEAYVE
jgi:hypothetical protein